MSRDQAYGGLIFVVALIIAIIYIIAFFAPYLGFPESWSWWAVAIPLFILVIGALGVFMWIGWTMLTTPPPLPLETEDLNSENEEQKESKAKKDK